ncbi:MAG: hypothetical protein K2X98_02720 [Alphaproteobacteria bacterium]|nr:hypothetical protein [Alphaproteobacteria bacterium]
MNTNIEKDLGCNGKLYFMAATIGQFLVKLFQVIAFFRKKIKLFLLSKIKAGSVIGLQVFAVKQFSIHGLWECLK